MTTKLRLIIGVIVAVVIALAIGATVFMLFRQPSTEDYRRANDSQLTAATEALDDLQPAVNEYLTAFKTAYNSTGSVDAAHDKAKSKHDAFIEAKNVATKAINVLISNRASNDGEVGPAIRQLHEAYTQEVDYMAGLVESYDEYTRLFSSKEKICSDMFIGKTSSLADREQKLDAAIDDCYEALATLKDSANPTFAEYAKKVEKQLKELQEYAKTVAQSEKDYAELKSEASTLEKQVATALREDASDEKLNQLRDKIAAVNKRVTQSQAEFDFASKRYTSTIKEMPTLYGDVFSTHIPTKLENIEKLIDNRVAVLKLALEEKLVK